MSVPRKLKPEDVASARSAYRTGRGPSARQLAARYGITHKTMLDALHGRTYKEIPMGEQEGTSR